MRTPTRPLASSLAKLPSAVAVCAALAIASASTAGAANFYWDADGSAVGNDIMTWAGLGGSGIWTAPTPATNWFDGAAANLAWPNTNPNGNTAVFLGVGGLVDLGSSVFVNALQFDSTGYTIGNSGNPANILTLSGVTPTISVTTSGHTATINALVAGNQGLSVLGAGTLVLGGGGLDTLANTFTGPLTLSSGILRLDKAAGTLATASTDLQLNGGTLYFGNAANLLASDLLPANANVTVSGAALNFHAGTGISAASQTLNSLTFHSGSMSTTNGTFTDASGLNTINVTNAFTVNGGTPAINSGTVFNAGSFTINGGNLAISGNSVLQNTIFMPDTVNLNGGTVTMNYGTTAGARRGEFFLSNTVHVGGTAATTIARGGSGTAVNEPAIILGDEAREFNVSDSTGSSAADLIIGVRIDSGGLVKTGAGTLQLNATGSPFMGNILVEGGTLAFVGSGNADQTALGTGPKTITLTNNATLALVGGTDADPNVAGGKGFVIGAGGGTIDVISGRTFFLNDGLSNGSFQDQLQGSGTLTKTGEGVLNVGRDFSASFTGDVKLNLGRLDVTVANALGNVGTITVDGTAGAARLNYTNGTAFGFTNNLVLQNGGVLSLTGAGHNLPNTKSITIGTGTSRIRLDDGAAATVSGTNRTFVLNGALNGSNTLEASGPSGANRGVLALSNAASNFSGTLVIDKNVSVENFARWNGTTATNTGKTIGTALIKFAAISGGSGSAVDGQLDLRDSGTGNNQVFNYGNNVDMVATGGTILVGNNTQQAIASTGGRFVLGTLGLGAGNTLTANTLNGYSLEFGGVTTLGGNATFAGSSDLTLASGIAGGLNLTKTSTGRLTIGAPTGATYTGSTAINAGGIVFDSASAIGGTGASVTLANGAYIGANFVATQANLVDRLVGNTNTSVIALGRDTAANLNLTALPNARLGAIGTVTYTGTLTPAGTTTFLGGGGGTLILPGTNIITGARALNIGTSGTAAGVVALDDAQDFVGGITLTGGQLLRIGGNSSLGNAANVITANGGGIQFKNAAAGYDIFATRSINFTGGFILDTNGYDYTPSVAIGTGGVGSFTKAGAGKLTLEKAALYNGKTIITGGTLSIAADNILGAPPSANTGDQLQIQSGGTFEANGTFTIPVQRGVQFSNGGGSIRVTDGNTLTIASSTSGSGQLIKEGSGTLLLTADPNNNNTNNTGGFFINAGVLALQHSGSTDAPFVINDTGTLRVLTANDLGDSYSVTVNTGGVFDLRASDQISQLFGAGTVLNDGTAATTLTVSSGTDATFGGVLKNGISTLGFTKAGANTVTFTGTNAHTGTTAINTGQIRVEGATARLNGGGVVVVGDNNGNDESLVLGSNTDVVTDVFDKIGDTAEVEFRGSTSVTLNGPAAGSTGFAETMGNIDFKDGVGIFTLNPAVGGQVQLTAAALIREFGTGTGVIRGTNLGGAGADSSRVLLGSTAGILAGSGGTGSSASIVPFVIGGSSSTAAPNTFLTYHSTDGLVPLKDTDYEATIAGAAGRNVSVSGGETVTANAAVNALRVTGGNTVLTDARVTLGSGAILFTGTGSINGTGTIDTGARQLVIHASGDTSSITGEINANIHAGAGIAVGDAGNIGHTIVLGGNNRIFGGVTVNGGALRAGSANALGLAGDPLNDLTLKAGNGATGGALSSVFQLGGNNISVLFAGNDRLQGSTRIQNASPVPATLTIVTNAGSDSNDGVLEDGTGGGALSIVKRGSATLTLEQANTYTGATEILGGTLRLNTGSARLTGTSSITIAGGGILNLNNTNSANQTDRLRDAAPITMRGGQFQIDNNQGAANYSETVGAFTSASGANTIMTDSAASGQTATLTLASLTVASGSALNFTNFGTAGDIGIGEGGTRNRVIFTANPAATNGILGGNVYYTRNLVAADAFDPVDFAAYDGGIIAFATYNTGAETTWTNTSVVRPAATATLTANRSVHAMKLGAGVDVSIGAGQTLNVVSGGIIYNPNSTAATTSTIADGKLTAGGTGSGELAIRVDGNLNAATLAITSEIADNGANVVSLLKSGTDALTLSGTNTYTGRTTIVEGAVNISADANLGAAPGAAAPGHLRLYGGALNLTAGTVTLSENRGIELGGGISTISAASGANLIYNGFISGSANGGLTLSGNVDMAFNDSTVIDRAFRITGSGSATEVATVALSGTENSIGESLQVGVDAAGEAALTYGVANGRLSVGRNNPNGSNLDVGVRTNNTGVATETLGTLDLTGANTLTARVDRVRVGVITADNTPDATVRGVLKAATNTDIQAITEVVISDSPQEGLGNSPSAIHLGAGTSKITSPLMTVGGRKANGSIDIAAGGVLTLGGFVPGAMDLRIAHNNQGGTGVTSLGSADFSGGTLNAGLNEVVVGLKSGTGGSTGGATGVLTLGDANNNVVANQIRLGDLSGDSAGTASGTLTLGGGTLLVNKDVALGLYTGTNGASGAAGTLNINGGSVTVGGNITTSNSDRATGTLSLNGGALDMTNGSINVDSFTVQAGVLRNVSEIYSGDGETAMALVKTGAGTLEIQGTNTYTGGTNVNEGTLLVNGSINGSLDTFTGTTLGGSGSINGALHLADSSTLRIELNGLEAGTGYNQMNMTSAAGSVSLGTNVTLSLSLGFAPNTSVDTFYFILTRADSGIGYGNSFAGLAEGAEIDLGNGFVGTLTYLANWTGNTATSTFTGGNDVAIAIPEPGTIVTLLGGVGLLGLGRFRRRSTRA